MKPNDDKCHLIVCNQENVSVKLGNETIHTTDLVDLLGVKIDKYLIFSEHVSELCKKATRNYMP